MWKEKLKKKRKKEQVKKKANYWEKNIVWKDTKA